MEKRIYPYLIKSKSMAGYYELLFDEGFELKIFDTIHRKLADYGFILRYLDGKDKITWFSYEPWHLRYIWDINISKEMYEKWLTLEEYLGVVKM